MDHTWQSTSIILIVLSLTSLSVFHTFNTITTKSFSFPQCKPYFSNKKSYPASGAVGVLFRFWICASFFAFVASLNLRLLIPFRCVSKFSASFSLSSRLLICASFFASLNLRLLIRFHPFLCFPHLPLFSNYPVYIVSIESKCVFTSSRLYYSLLKELGNKTHHITHIKFPRFPALMIIFCIYIGLLRCIMLSPIAIMSCTTLQFSGSRFYCLLDLLAFLWLLRLNFPVGWYFPPLSFFWLQYVTV